MGAVLLQEGDNSKLHPIAYGIRSLTKTEHNYYLGKLEFLCAKWAVTNQFKQYLLYWPFVIRTNNNPLTYIAITPNLDACGHRWVWALANYNFTLEYHKGQNNVAADALSQVTGQLSQEEVKAILDGSKVGCPQCAELPPLVHQLGEKEGMVCIAAARHVPAEMHVIDWAKMKIQ